jgi:K+-sensing histidine kinase KdpD
MTAGPRGYRVAREYLEVVAAIALVTAVGRFVRLSYPAYGHIYLLAVIALSLRVSRWPVLFAALLSAFAWDYFFVSPRMSFAVLDFDDTLLLGIYFVVALVAGQLTTYIREHEKLSAEAELHRTLFDTVSHELKTPLSVLRSASEKVDTDDAAKRATITAEIAAATSRLDHLVANLLNQTRLESGVLRPRLDWCDARDLINSARGSLGGSLAGRAFTAVVPQDMPLFKADPPMMEQAIANLLLNAALHTPAGTPLFVTTGVEPKGRRVFITVADRGPGLPPELNGTLFQKFQRGSGARTGGLGLGLSIVRGFVVAQGGEVVASGNPGGGAQFTIFLPVGKHGRIPSE